MQVVERKMVANDEIVYYVEHELEPNAFLMIECTTKPQAIALARLLQATNDIYTEERLQP